MESRTIMGEVISLSGPDGLPRSQGLSKSLKELGLPILRFKTGTPVRVNLASIDLSQMSIQSGEDDIPPFSFENEMKGLQVASIDEQVPCYSIWTTDETRQVIHDNMDRSPLYSGVIEGTGPRYCPSIEDKFVRFKDKSRHQIFVEHMGNDTNEMYLQGFSTSLPEQIQEQMVHSLPGLQKATIQRNAYAIEYDLVDPLSVKPSLESKIVDGLFTAGQVNGSSGYEEAAAQGIVAGINASLKVLNKEPMILTRSQAYIGVLVDDLVTKGTNEPYRMMTSRAEYRLFLRQDNCDRRLTPIGHEIGLIDNERFCLFEQKQAQIIEEKQRLKSTFTGPVPELVKLMEDIGMKPPQSGISLEELIRRPGITYDMVSLIDKNRKDFTTDIKKAVETDIKYEGYLKLEEAKIASFKKLEEKAIPQELDYEVISGLRLEAKQKLNALRPVSVGQASRISGVSPADIAVLLVFLEANKREFKHERL